MRENFQVSDLATPTIAALLRLGSIAQHGWDETLQEILLVTSDVLKVERTSYWRFRDEPPSIVCELGYQAGGQRYERGSVLREADAGPYFEAVKQSQVMPVQDARLDPRTSCLREYLDAHGVGSLLDTALRSGRNPIGILCVEHVGKPRSWTAQEQEFAFSVSQVLAARVEADARSEAEARVRQARFLADVSASMAETFEPTAAARLAAQGAVPILADLALVLASEGDTVRCVAESHIDKIDGPQLEALLRRRPPKLETTGLISHAICERQTLFLPRVTPQVSSAYRWSEQDLAAFEAFAIRSVIVVPFIVRGELTGAMLFATTTEPYRQSEVQFAERYAYGVAIIMENARLYKKAQEAIRARDDFLSMASHELRTPITSLRLFAQKLAQKASHAAPATVIGLSERILRQTARLDRMAERLLDTCEIGAGYPSIERAPTDLVTVVDDVVQAFTEPAAHAGSQLLVSFPGPVVGLWDPVRLEQIVANLLDNSIKFGEGKPIHIDVDANEHRVRLSIRDEGPGISDEEAAHVFERYWRSKRAKNHGGLGLGLYVVSEMAKAQGGTVRLESREGRGSTFTLELPLGP